MGTPQALPAISYSAMLMAAMAVPKVAPPFQGSRFWISSVNRTTPSGSCPISSGFHSCRVASTEGTSHSPLPSPQPHNAGIGGDLQEQPGLGRA